MTQQISEQTIRCPNCAHHIHITLDTTSGDQNYYDECPACCKEFHLDMHIDDYRQKINVAIDGDDEQIY